MEQPDFVKAIQNGDADVLRQLYAEQLPRIRRLLTDYGGSDSDAQDVFQDAVLIVYQKVRQPGFQLTSQFGTFFYGICRNLWLNRRTKKSATSEVTFSVDIKYMEDPALTEADELFVERGNLFWNAFQKLGADCQKLLKLFFEKTPMEAIAEQMGYASDAYARRRKMQCKQYLTRLVKNDPAYPELL
ncbi:MAG: sigma-70 family RNA polymerase sigma factor [Lewinellaceae bacterium]|nr:sigma-70 family RNA polymerase sigma factor [Lewinellaceae bacterium]